MLSDFQAKLRATGVKETTIAGHLRHLRAALGWAVSQELLPKVPKIEMPKRAKGVTKTMRGRPITTEEYERMLASVAAVRKVGSEQVEETAQGPVAVRPAAERSPGAVLGR